MLIVRAESVSHGWNDFMSALIKDKQRQLRRDNSEFKSGVFVEIPKEKWSYPAEHLVRVPRSRDFFVQIYVEPIPSLTQIRITVCRTMINGKGDFVDGITWDELMEVKRGCGYGDFDAVEAYPKDGDIVNVANFRHLWIVSENYSNFFWRKKSHA